MSPLRIVLYLCGFAVAVRVADAIADAVEASPGPARAARRVELEQQREHLEAELQGVRLVRELPADAERTANLTAQAFGPPKEPAKA